jgi:hypothetical protein
VSPTATATTPPTLTSEIYWNQSSYTVNNQSYFQAQVNMTNALLLTSGQFDVCFDPSIISPNLSGSRSPKSTGIDDIYDRSRFGGPSGGCGWIVQPVGSSNISSGCIRILVDLGPWVQVESGGEPCYGGDFCGVQGSGNLTILTFRALKAGTCNISFCAGGGGGKLQMVQIYSLDTVDSFIYQNYTYPCSPNPPSPTPTPCTPDRVLIWGGNASVTVNP